MATPINKLIVNQILERNEKGLARQQEALKATLDELAMLELVNQDGAYSAAIVNIRTRRDRQAALVKATETAVAAYRQLLKKA